MSGHNHWSQIKEHKGSADVKRGIVFSKLLRAISIAAREEPNPDFNPRLRSAIQKAREMNVPQENIERAINKASTEGAAEEVVMEAYGPGGTALLIVGYTDNTNRTIQEIKAILKELDAKWAEPGSVRWAFEQLPREQGFGWQAKFKQDLAQNDKEKLEKIVAELESHDDIEKVYSNAQ